MSEYLKLATAAGDLYLAALADTQDTLLRCVDAFPGWRSAVAGMPLTMFGANGLPTADEVIEVHFSFAAKLLERQQEVVGQLLSMSAGVGLQAAIADAPAVAAPPTPVLVAPVLTAVQPVAPRRRAAAVRTRARSTADAHPRQPRAAAVRRRTK